MAAIDEMTFTGGTGITLPGITDDIIKALVSRKFWAWYEEHKDDRLFKVDFWIFNKTIRVRKLRGLFEQLFGPRPPVV